MSKFERIDLDYNGYSYFNEVVKDAFDKLEEQPVAQRKKIKRYIDLASYQAEIEVVHDPYSDKKSFRYKVYLQESSLMSVSTHFTPKGEPSEKRESRINDNYQEATVDDIVYNFLDHYHDGNIPDFLKPPE